MPGPHGTIDPAVLAAADAVAEALAVNSRAAVDLPSGGRLHIDRQLPFCCVARSGPGPQDAMTAELITSEAAYIRGAASPEFFASLDYLCRRLVESLVQEFDGVLILEVWAAAEPARPTELAHEALRPHFRIVAPDGRLTTTVEALAEALREVTIAGQQAEVEIVEGAVPAPPGLPPLLQPPEQPHPGCFHLGLEVLPVYYDSEQELEFPQTFALLRAQLTGALRRSFAAFAGSSTSYPPVHFEALGVSTMEDEAGEVDRLLSEVAEAYDFLLLLTPTNTEDAWSRFRSSHFERAPTLFYRPLPFDVDLQKRRLFNIRLEEVSDPTLQSLLRAKRDEMDLELTTLQKRGLPGFRYPAMQLFGEVSPELLQSAKEILAALAERDAKRDPATRKSPVMISGPEFRKIALAEIEYYRQQNPRFDATVELRDDIGEGLMVSRNRLLVPIQLRIPESRVRALLQHEIGTHLLTHFNGRQQPFRQMATGLAGYEVLQEGLAVLSEFLVGGLSSERMRTLALRVIAADAMLDRASFVDVFRLLHQEHSIDPEKAFSITVRTFRGGGFPKDLVYLQGVIDLLPRLNNAAEFALMWVGKIALEDLPSIRELRRREIVVPAALLPRHFNDASYRNKLERCHTMSARELVEE
ncbi:flavohemoglobin expression-modulating QEGLA motif protein [Candidatus Laterigemmans baculatus]|uniref:flavohemoglobin expression-modulating QEGLA motif protein n=1 Tax=Candidatus Laterigemmans baculatus TaxID=2770505 RepID=UPI0013DBF25D|nr:tyrosine/phenylalanine carboxypeptidase domain-containing protein [Candidatus Laterigemmans baculatus]